MSNHNEHRRRFAEDVRAASGVTSPVLFDALATVPREAFLPPGPWVIRGGGPAQTTPDADPRHVYQNVSVAIDERRQLFNGAPSTVLPALDALDLHAGDRVLHVGCGLGYYTAILAHLVGSAGAVHAEEVDEGLAQRARENLAAYGNVTVQHGDGAGPLDRRFDAILVHAGLTHPLDVWLDVLPVGGRAVLPLTTTFPGVGDISKGVLLALTKTTDQEFSARSLGLIVIYTAVGLRDESLNSAVGTALMRGLADRVARLRRDVHQSDASCLYHGSTFCLQA